MEIRVSTEELRKRAGEAEEKVNKLTRDFDRVSELIVQTSGCWIGEAGDLYRKTFNSERPEMERILKRLREFPKDLLEMAGIYERNEAEIGNMSDGLPIDVIL